MKFATITEANSVITESKENDLTSYFGYELLGERNICGWGI